MSNRVLLYRKFYLERLFLITLVGRKAFAKSAGASENINYRNALIHLGNIEGQDYKLPF